MRTHMSPETAGARAGLLALQICVLAAALAAVHSLSVGVPRDVATAYLFLVAPGAAVALPMRLPSAELKVLCGLTISIVTDLLAAQAVVRFTGLDANDVLGVVVAVTVLGLLLQATRLRVPGQGRRRHA